MALTVEVTPAGGRFVEFVRFDLEAKDDGSSPSVTGKFEILFTTDGSLPSDENANTIRRISPVRRFPLSGPTTLKFLARTLTSPTIETDVETEFYDIIELTARGQVRSVPSSVSNYTLKVTNKDISRTDGGFYSVVFGPEKTAQDVREIILVETVPSGRFVGNRTLPGFGSELNTILGKPFPVTFAASRIQASIFQALKNLIALQRRSRAPANEQISRVLNISVVPQFQGDATAYRYSFIVETVSGETSSGSGTVVEG